MHALLAGSPVVLLFAVVGLGWLLGSLRLGGFRLGVAGVLFVGLAFGALDPAAYVLPEVIVTLGLILFVYTVGLQSGPVFFSLFGRQWHRLSALALIAIVAAALVAFIASTWLGLPGGVAAGLFCGGLTNTPALAAVIEALKGLVSGTGIDESQRRLLLDGPTVGYSIAYPFGVLGLILAMQLVPRLFRVDLARERARAVAHEGLPQDELAIREFRVENPLIAGKTFAEAALADATGVIFTRVRRGQDVILVEPQLAISAGDVLVGVGPPAAIQRAELMVGPRVEVGIERLASDIEFRDLLVINRTVVGWSAEKLSAAVGHPVIISRIRRGGIGIAPRPTATLELGDQVRVVAHRSDLEKVTGLVGNPLKDYSEADFLSFSLGLILGVLLGTLPIPLPGGNTVMLGFAGGPLVVALILGRLGRTGPIVWTMPPNANLTLRQLGILLFLAGVGTRAGGSFLATLESQGAVLLLTGAAVTAVSMVSILYGACRIFGYDLVSAFGILAGIHTQPAALAFANSYTGSESPNLTYAAVYPIALIAKIVLAQLLVLW